MLWCRSCGNELSYEQLYLRLEEHDKFQADSLRWNIFMQCASCVVGRPIGRDSSRVEERALYYLITYGIVRVEFFQKYKPEWLRNMPIHLSTRGHAESGRQIPSRAVSKMKGVWVASHKQEAGYFMSHLKTVPTPCMPFDCPINLTEVQIQREAQEKTKREKMLTSP